MGELLNASPALQENRRPRVSGETAGAAMTLGPAGVAGILGFAADKVERYASQFSRWSLPWYAMPESLRDEDLPPSEWEGDDWEIHVQPSPVRDDAPEPHEFALETHGALPMMGGFMADELPPPFARWVAMMGPQVAGPLVAALRHAASLARAGSRPDRDPLLRHLVELAIEISHEEDPRDDG